MIDFMIGKHGDLHLGEEREISSCSGEKLREQMAINRIKSISKDWRESHIGSDLESFLGKDAKEETLRDMERQVINALCYDGYFQEDNVYIKTFLKDNSYVKMLIYIKTLNNKGSFSIDVELDLVKGVNVIIGG